MYGFEGVFDGQLLVGKSLTSAQFAENVVSLTFTDGINFSVSNEIRFSLGGDGKPRIASAVAIDEALLDLIGRRVVRARVASKHKLVLDLDIGFIEFVDDLAMFECVVVTVRDRVFAI